MNLSSIKETFFELRERFLFVFRTYSGRERFIFFFFTLLFVGGLVASLIAVNKYFMVTVPARGGTLVEGIVGTPRFINPLLAITDADRDLTALAYSGLLRALPSGEVIPDLAESYEISPDGLHYTVRLRDNIWFHDGAPVTADDVIFTVAKAQDPELKSPRRASWEGVVVERVDDRVLQFSIRQPFAPFIENLTMGILPKHIWQKVNVAQFGFSTYNTSPIGSGPYLVERLKQDSSGVPAYYDLLPFERFALGSPYIEHLRVRFYPNDVGLRAALDRGEVDQMSAFSPVLAEELERGGYAVTRSPLPRVFGVFFNQNQAPVLVDQNVRRALELAVDKERIVREVLRGYGAVVGGPIPAGMGGLFSVTTISTSTPEERRLVSESLLAKAGWKKDVDGSWYKKSGKPAATTTLALSISTSEVPELKAVAERVVEDWKTLGIQTELKIFESGDLNQNVIRPRKYETLLFGEIVGREADLFAFWHSSQRNDPGLNIALYANRTADRLLEELRAATSSLARAERYVLFESEVSTDVPAVFLYSPNFLYLVSPSLKGFATGGVSAPGDRFGVVHDWYLETDRVWSIFANTRNKFSYSNL